MQALENILRKYNFPKKSINPSTTFEQIEKEIGFTLPDDYKYFLGNYQEQEAFIGPQWVKPWEVDELFLLPFSITGLNDLKGMGLLA